MKLLQALALAGLAVVGPVAHAASVYSYTGDNYTTIVGSGLNTAQRIEATLTLSTPLPANMAFADISGLLGTFEVANGRKTFVIPPNNAVQNLVLFVSTDATGNIDTWNFSGQSALVFRGDFHFVASINHDGLTGDRTTIAPFSGGFGSLASVATPGAWTHVVPLPGTLLLFVPGLGLLTYLCVGRRAQSS